MDRTAVITGAGGDIGRAIAIELAKTHAHLALLDISAAGLDKTEAHLKGNASVTVSKHICDITEPAAVEETAANVARVTGQPHIHTLVNNAGRAGVVTTADSTLATWRAETALNLDGAVVVFKAFETALRAYPRPSDPSTTSSAGESTSPSSSSDGPGAVVINIASANGLGIYGHPAYSAAKAGLIHWTKFLAVEYGRFGIRANAVAPGTVFTQLWDQMRREKPDLANDISKLYPLKRAIQPADVAAAVAFLVHAPVITGVCLPVDGGLTAGSPPAARAITQSDAFGDGF